MNSIQHHLTYPKQKTYTSDSRLSGVINERIPPVAIVLGWVGCSDTHLSQYSKIFEERGFVTLRITPPMEIIFWKRNLLIEIGAFIVKKLEEEDLDDHPVFVHCMSNGGAILYIGLSSAIEKFSKPIRILGVAFDSAPGGRDPVSVYRVISTVIGKNAFRNWIESILLTSYLVVAWYFDIFKAFILGTTPSYEDLLMYLRSEKRMTPQFLFYSMNDTLVPYKDVEEFIAIRRNRGVDVKAICFKGSYHIQHYTTYPEEYLAGLCDFIKRCLAQNKL